MLLRPTLIPLFIAGVLFLTLSCGQSFNSNSGDFALRPVALGDGTPEGERLKVAYEIMQNQCMSCHPGYSAYRTNEAWIEAGLVKKQDPDGSVLIRSLNNYFPPGGMPPSGTLSNSDYSALLEWVEFMP